MTATEEAAEAAPDAAMPGTAVAVRPAQGSTMLAKIQYAAELAKSGLLPSQYRRQPANVLYAVEYGEMLGLPPMAAITGIHVIEGKPTASAGLISALVRRAGHKLRVTGNDKTATATITRADDPDFTFTSTWTLERAKAAELLGKGTWKKYPAAMLKARAITEVARDACEEALCGMHYTPEELGSDVDEEGHVVGGVLLDEPAADPVVTGQPDVRDAWYDRVLERAAAVTEDTYRALWAEISQGQKADMCTPEQRKEAEALIAARMDDIRNGRAAAEPAPDDGDIVEGVIVGEPEAGPVLLQPEDSWYEAVAQVTSSDDAAALIANVNAAKGLTRQRKDEIIAAVRAREASLLAGAFR